jgi:hypothetical protein
MKKIMNKRFIVSITLIVFLLFSVSAWAARTAYQKTALTGGASTALDYIDGANLVNGDFAFVMTGGNIYFYVLNATSGAAESSPNIIAPDTSPGDKRWILQTVYGAGTGDVVGPANNTDNNIPQWNGADSKTLKDGLGLDTDGNLAANSDAKVPSQKAVKTYADTKLPSSYLDTDGTLAANSDVKVASQKATKTYADGKLAFPQAAITLTAESGTPALTAGKYFYKTANTGSTTYSNFTGGTEGQYIWILVNDNNSIFDFTSTNLIRAEGTDYTAVSGDVIQCVYDGTNWYCLVWGVNAADGSRYADFLNNSAYVATAGKYRLLFEGGILTIDENGTKRVVSATDRTETLTNKTFDVEGAGNVLKSWGYIVLTHPHLCAAGAPMQTTSTSNTYGQCKFGNATDKATNYAEYYLTVPADIDTSVDLTAIFKFKLDNADTNDHEYEISMDGVADSAAYAGSLANAVSLTYTADASGAQYDVESTTETTLTDWKANVSAGQLWVIRLARDGDHASDSSTVDSYTGPLVIKYKKTQ